jgi:hypothetical protein
MNNNRGATTALVWAFAGLSAAMMFGGSVLLLTAAFRDLAFALGIGGLLVPGVRGLTAALGARGLLGAIGPLGPAAAVATVAIAGLYAYLVGIKGTKDKSGGWHPAWMKGTFWERDIDEVLFGKGPSGTSGVSFAAPRNPKADFERQEAEAKKRNDHLIDETWKAILWLGKQLDITVNFDGKTMARAVSKEQAKAASGPVGRSPARFNSAMTPAQP